MHYEVDELGPCKKRVTVTVPAETVDGEFDKTYARLRSHASLPGFRPGRVPRRVLERRFGDQVREEVAEELFRNTVREAVSELELEPVSPPSPVDGTDSGPPLAPTPGSDLTVSFEVELKPEFELPDYKGVAVTREEQAVTDEDVENVLSSLAESRAHMEPAGHDTWQEGDHVIADIKVLALDGETVLAKEEEQDLPPDPDHILGFVPERRLSEVLEGVSTDSTLRVGVKRSTDEEEAEEHGVAEITVLEFKRRVLPDVDDAFAKEQGAEDLQSLKEGVRERLRKQAAEEADREVVRRILEKLVADADIPLAEGPTQRMLDKRLQRRTIDLMMSGMSQDQVMERIEEERQEIRADIEFDTRSWLLAEKIAKKEKIFCLEEDIDARIEKIAESSGTTPTRVRQYYEENEMIPELRASILEEKVCNFLKEHADVTEKSVQDGESGDAAREAGA